MAKFNATDIRIEVDGNTIAHETEASIEFSRDMIDVTSKDSSANREIIPGLRSFSMTFSALVDYAKTFGIDGVLDSWLNGTLVTIKYRSTTAGNSEYTGSGFFSTLSAEGPLEDAHTFSGTIEGTAAPVRAATP